MVWVTANCEEADKGGWMRKGEGTKSNVRQLKCYLHQLELNRSIYSPLPYREVHQNHGQKVMEWPSPELIPEV